jgi:hypothetical protein
MKHAAYSCCCVIITCGVDLNSISVPVSFLLADPKQSALGWQCINTHPVWQSHTRMQTAFSKQNKKNKKLRTEYIPEMLAEV